MLISKAVNFHSLEMAKGVNNMEKDSLSKQQLRDIQEVADILFNLENEVKLSDLGKNPVFTKLSETSADITDIVKELFTHDNKVRLSRDIFNELSATCVEKVIWRQDQGVIMQDVYNNQWLLREAIRCYTERHYSEKHYKIIFINDVVYQQFLINCYKNRGIGYRVKLLLTEKLDKLICLFEERFDYREFH